MSTQKKKAASTHRAAERSGAPNLGSLMKCALCALPITAGVGLLLLLLTTAILMKTADPNRYHAVAGLLLLYLTAAVGGAIATRLYRRRSPLLCGLAEGMLLLLLITAAALFLPDGLHGAPARGIAILTRISLLPAALLGALIAAHRKERRRKRRR